VQWIWLAVGGGLGAVARYGLTQWVDARHEGGFPFGTLAVNVVGCFAIGVIATLADEGRSLPPTARLLLVTGVLGGFTTFSAFGLDTLRMLEAGRLLAGFANAAGSVVLGVAAVVAGVAITRALG
jgi:CrcB protein